MQPWIHDLVQKHKANFVTEVLRLLEEGHIEAAFPGFTQRERVYHLIPLFRTFLAQVMNNTSCREAIAQAISQQWIPPTTSPLTAAYCNAKGRLPESPILELFLTMGRCLAATIPNAKRFMRRPVRVIDGSSTQMPDTPSNQAQYSQPRGQKPGCGFPVLYFAAMMDHDTGAMIDMETWAMGGHERTGFRRMWRSLNEGDIALGDGGLGSYADMVMLQKRGIDSVFRVGQRKFDLPMGDHIVTLDRPERIGDWVGQEDLPETLKVRIIRFRVHLPGGRVKIVTIMTTLLDRRLYTKRKLMRLYRRRWEVELRLRDIKTTMGLERLHSLTPEGCRKELWMGLLGYNLIRTIMVAAAHRFKRSPEAISFAGTLQRLRTFTTSSSPCLQGRDGWLFLLEHVALDMLPYRPNRVEPRKLKRRHKNYRLLNRPRQVERAELVRA